MEQTSALLFALRRLMIGAALAILTAAAMTARADAQTVVVVVNGDPVTNYDIEQRSKLSQLGNHKVPPRQEVIEELIKAPDRPSLVAHTRALDRVLQYGYSVIPHYHVSAFRVAYWDKFRRPAISPKFAVGLDTWWIDPSAEKSVEAKKGEVTKQ